MTNRFWTGLSLLLVIPALLFAASCAKKQLKSEAEIAATAEEAGTARLQKQAMKSKEFAERERFLNKDIHFEFDKSRLLAKAKRILRRKAKWLTAHPGVSVIIEGHCDERGTNEYNMALGDRRARSTKTFLIDLGIARNRLTTISYGEERPLDYRRNEESWAKNRRAHFVID